MDVVNFYDVLYIHLVILKIEKVNKLQNSYQKFIALYDEDKIPQILKHMNGIVYSFKEAMALSNSRFQKYNNMMTLLKNIQSNFKSNN